VLVVGTPEVADRVATLLMERLKGAVAGVPAETRAATDSGETRYMRPRPGSQRMYPETDIPDIMVTERMLREASGQVPEEWEASLGRLRKGYSLSRDLALKLFDSEIADEFEELARRLRLEPSYIASVLVDIPARLAREGVPEGGLGLTALTDALNEVASGRMAKEAVPDVIATAARKGVSVREAAESMGLGTVSTAEVQALVDALVLREHALVREKGAGAFSALMGEAMKQLRGRADGAEVARILREKLQEAGRN